MISHKTVLILGAGASRPYLLPTGGELRDLILQRNYDSILRSLELSGPDQKSYVDWYRELLCNHIRQEQIEDFQMRFAESEFVSIDRFLAFNPEFDDTGRFMIAAILLNCERTPHLKGDWYQILFNELTTDGPDISADLLSVVTFNYDRSLESRAAPLARKSPRSSLDRVESASCALQEPSPGSRRRRPLNCLSA